MTGAESRDATLASGDVERLLRRIGRPLSAATIRRIPRDQLDYWPTPGGRRRYREADVIAYARTYLGASQNPAGSD